MCIVSANNACSDNNKEVEWGKQKEEEPKYKRLPCDILPRNVCHTSIIDGKLLSN